MPAKVITINVPKVLIVLAAFLAPIAVAAGVAGGAMLNSPRTLAVALGAAWVASALVGYGFYGGKRTLEAATLLLVVALVVIVAYARPWGGGGAEENVVFLYNASFTYENSSDNLPIENILLSFPHPNIDNEPVLITGFSWSLFGSNPENQDKMVLQIQDGRVVQLLGDRKSTLFIQYGRENTQYGPRISLSMDKVFPREVLVIQAYALTTSVKSKDMTICENKENKRVYGRYQYQPSEKITKISFWAQLAKKMDDNLEKIEEFNCTVENAQPFMSSVWVKLNPTN